MFKKFPSGKYIDLEKISVVHPVFHMVNVQVDGKIYEVAEFKTEKAAREYAAKLVEELNNGRDFEGTLS